MTKQQAIKEFINSNSPFSDYWSMQQTWEWYIDGLCRGKSITQRQFDNWGNPCTVENFKKFNKKFKPFED